MKKILVFLMSLLLLQTCLIAENLEAEKLISIVKSDNHQTKLKLESTQLTLKESIQNNQEVKEIKLQGVENSTVFNGMPELPILGTLIAIPPQGNFNVTFTYDSVDIIPLNNPKLYYTEEGPLPITIEAQNLFPENFVTFSEPAILRDFRVIQLNIYPCQYDFTKQQLRYYHNIQVHINYTTDKGINELPFESYDNYSYVFQNIYEAQIANFDEYRNPLIAPEQGRILLIYGNTTDANFLTKLNEFVTWKRQKGYEVNVVSTAQTGGTSNTSIKNYIQNQYDNPETRPDYIILLGDTTGSYIIPTWYENYSNYNGEGDYPYTHLAGNDTLGDVFIGRISVENLSQLATVFNKIYTYEKNINISADAASWLNRMLLIGDPSSSGISVIYSNKYIKEMSSKIHPDYTYIENYTSSCSSTMNSGINQGVSFFNYRGYINMSGWSPSESLNNGPRLPHSVILTCGTGGFAGTSTTETFVRLGSEAVPKGALTAIGMATSGTHTSFNNALSCGIFDGIFLYGMRNMGEALLNGKLYLWNVYGTANTSYANSFAHWCNLIGDPTVEAFVGIPKGLLINAPDSIPRGCSLVDINITDLFQNPMEGVSVTLYNSVYQNVVSKGYTDETGTVTLQIPSFIASNLLITASQHNCKPVQKTLSLNQEGSLVYFEKYIIDNGTAGSSGNGDSFIEAGETIALNVEIKNTTTHIISGLQGILSTTNPYINIQQAQATYPDIVPEDTGVNNTYFLLHFANNIPSFLNARFNLELTDTQQNIYQIIFHMGAYNANFNVNNRYVFAGGDTILDPSETGILSVSITNNSICGISNIYGELQSMNDLVSVPDSISYFGNVMAGMTVNSIDSFSIMARPQLIPGMIIPFQLRLYNTTGFEQLTYFNLPIGTVSQNTPLGPDEYGYFIYDVSDTAYPDCPVYEWIEIVPSLGGSGTLITGLNDLGALYNEGDQIGSDVLETINLPFTFPYYGIEYNQITICVNGFIVFGVTENGEFRNGRMPGGQGPSPMIAPFWDDLIILSNAGIYQYYDIVNHIFIVEYHNLKNGFNRTSEETFEVIFYDPHYYPTSLGDGMIKFQYKVFNNVDVGSGGYSPSHGKYATVGIRDHTNRRGLEYTFNNQYPLAAQPLSNNKALLITTVPILQERPHLVIGDFILQDDNGNGWMEPGESGEIGIKLNNLGIATATDVHIIANTVNPQVLIQNAESDYPDIPGSGSAVNIDPITISISPECSHNTTIELNLTVSISGNSWNYIQNITVKKPQLSLSGVYMNDLQGNINGMADPAETFNLIVHYTNDGSVAAYNITSNISCMSSDVDILNPQQLINYIPAGATCQVIYEITLSPNVSVGNNLTFYITYLGEAIEAHNETIRLNVGTTGMYADFENNNGSFVTQPANNAWQWGSDSIVGAHSGTKCWGTLLNQQYPNYATWTLTSPVIYIGPNFVLEFWHWYDMEQGYDGGNLKISTNSGGSWTLLTPEGGYPYQNVSALSGPGYTGNSQGWVLARFNLSNYANQNVMFRWTFSSDPGIQGWGWYIDDVQTTGYIPFAGKLYGIVFSSNPEINYSQVLIQNSTLLTSQPDSDGNYVLYLPGGLQSVNAIAPGYQTETLSSININLQNPAINHDFFLAYFAPATNLSFRVVQDSLYLNWSAPEEPFYPILNYKVFRKLNAGNYELMGIYSQTYYNEQLSTIGNYRYYVVTCYETGESVGTEPISFSFPYVDITDQNINPLVSKLYQNYPNPFNPSTTIRFDLAKGGPVKLSIYNIKGQLVNCLVDDYLREGSHTIVWNGKDKQNRSVSSGIYFIRIESKEFNSVRRAILMK